MDLEILNIASDTINFKDIKNHTHYSKLKNSLCGDEMKIKLIIKNEKIIDFGYQGNSCVYCQASASLITHKLIKKSKNEINYLLKNLIYYFEKEIKILPKNLNKFNKLFNKKNISRKNCVLMPLIALKKLNIDE